MPSTIGIYIIYAGIGLIVIGVLVWSGALSWLGNLPGDIRIERGSNKIYIPVTSMLLISALFTILFQLIKKL